MFAAARGVGWSWGMAEECGEAASWLAQYGLPWADIILNCLQNPYSATISPAPKAWASNADLCGLHAGVTLAEFAQLPEGPTPQGVTIGNVRDARLLLPFVARCAITLDTTLRVSVAFRPWADVTATTIALETDKIAYGLVLIRMAKSSLPPTHAKNFQTASLSILQKAQLDAFALKMTVPSSAQSEGGAGGDTSDRD